MNQLDDYVHELAKQAIADYGGAYKEYFVQFFKTAPEDFHLKKKTWAVSYQHAEQESEIEGIGLDADRRTSGTLRVTFSLPGSSVKDTSREDRDHADNWGTRLLPTRQTDRRIEHQTCRTVANEFGAAFLRKRIEGVLKGFIAEDEDPQPVSRKLVFFSTTIMIEYEIWWN